MWPALTATFPQAGRAQEARGRRILLVGDVLEIAAEIRDDLAGPGCPIGHVATGPQRAAQALRGTADLLTVDRMLPGLDWLALIRRARARGVHATLIHGLRGQGFVLRADA